MDGNELVIGSFLNVRGDFTRNRQVENFLTFFVSEGDDHKFKVLVFAYFASGNFLNLRIRSRLVKEKVSILIRMAARSSAVGPNGIEYINGLIKLGVGETSFDLVTGNAPGRAHSPRPADLSPTA